MEADDSLTGDGIFKVELYYVGDVYFGKGQTKAKGQKCCTLIKTVIP